MRVLRKSFLELFSVVYWAVFAFIAYSDSRRVGYYPPSVRKEAQQIALSMSIPWENVLVAWGIFAAVILLGYLILRFAKAWRSSFTICFVVFMAVYIASVPTDVGGVHYAGAKFMLSTFVLMVISLLVPSRWLGNSEGKNDKI
jgi:hypothetical protein